MSSIKTLSPASVMIEQNIAFSKSILWKWIKDFYIKGGLDVWAKGDIPFEITNTPLLASEWAQTIFALLRDFHRQGALDPAHPIEITELGPGTGRHAYFLLCELKRLEKHSSLIHPQGFRFTLRLAELGAKGLQALSNHPQLQPFLADKSLVLANFDISKDTYPQDLDEKAIAYTPSPNPVFIIANYVLDSLAHDVIYLKGSKRSLGHATVTVRGLEREEEPNSLKDLGERINLKFSYHDSSLSYSDEDWNEVLRRYSGLNETYLPFPTTAMTFLQHLRSFSTSFACLLVADKSYVNIDQLRSLDEPQLVAHGGGFSFNANTHTLGYLAEIWGGTALHTSPRDGSIDLSHIIIPSMHKIAVEPLYEMNYRFQQLEHFHAVDRFRLRESVSSTLKNPNLRLCLDLIRLSGFESQSIYELSEHILTALNSEELDEETESELRSVLPKCLSNFYHVGDDTDVPFEIGRIAYQLEMYTLSELAFKTSLEQFGQDPRTLFNLGLGWFYQGRIRDARTAFKSALKLNPNYQDATVWLEKTKAKQRLKNDIQNKRAGL